MRDRGDRADAAGGNKRQQEREDRAGHHFSPGRYPHSIQQARPMNFTINGKAFEADPDIRTTVLDLCREHLGLTGSKKGCDHGQCGACTMLVNGRRINSCLTLAVMHQDDEITTIEGLGTPDHLHPLQSAFVRHDGYQCGYCTPGQICSAAGMLDEVAKGWPSYVSDDLAGSEFTDEEISERMSGNLCRCAAYPNIVAAIRDVADEDAAAGNRREAA
ncbi:MAG: 2Fe-2S iron-sulfur cluster-binding protein [Janthinobacterium lividum]